MTLFVAQLGHSQLTLADTVLLLLAAAAVYPDAMLDYIGERTGKSFGWGHVIAWEVITVVLIITATVLLMPYYPRTTWWKPLLCVGLMAFFRLLKRMITGFFGFGD